MPANQIFFHQPQNYFGVDEKNETHHNRSSQISKKWCRISRKLRNFFIEFFFFFFFFFFHFWKKKKIKINDNFFILFPYYSLELDSFLLMIFIIIFKLLSSFYKIPIFFILFLFFYFFHFKHDIIHSFLFFFFRISFFPKTQ